MSHIPRILRWPRTRKGVGTVVIDITADTSEFDRPRAQPRRPTDAVTAVIERTERELKRLAYFHGTDDSASAFRRARPASGIPAVAWPTEDVKPYLDLINHHVKLQLMRVTDDPQPNH